MQQISVARGGSTLCVYDAFSSGTLVASKVVRTSPGRDRLRITAARQEHFPEDNALVTATGYVGRSGDAEFTPDVAEQHEGNVIVTATRISRRCPKSTPDEFAPNTNAIDVSTARFSEQITAYGAFGLGDKLRLCAYLTAQRRVLGDIQTRTLARASTTISADTATTGGTQGPELDVTFGGALAWIIVGLLIAGIVATVRYFARDARPAGAPQLAGARPGAPSPIWPTPPTARPSDPQPPTQRPEADADVVPPHPAERARGRAKPRDVIQDAVDAVADTYRDRLQTILERQDGPDWLAALNQRRDLRITQAGKTPPRHYQSLEPRAVLTCLARDPAGMQLISKSAADSARQLAGLINDALHPNPQSPLTEADGHRAWQLYTDITGHIRPGDPFGR